MHSFSEQLHQLIRAGLREDIGDGDHSTFSSIPVDAMGKAVLKIKQDCVLAGVEVAKAIFAELEPAAAITVFKKDGDRVLKGEEAFTVTAKVHTILKAERLVLNSMQRMSGIATLTAQYAALLEGYHTRILDTRKTTPNFRLLEKEAVRIGGGFNHRMGLYDMIMLKDNHIDFAGGIGKAVDRAHDYVQRVKPGLKIEVETRNLQEVQQVLENGKAHRIMLDNFTPELLKEAIHLINGRMETEASGGINLSTIKDYGATGVDFVSVGALIHQAQSVDLSLKAVTT